MTRHEMVRGAQSNAPRAKPSITWPAFVAFLRKRGDRVTHARQIIFNRVMAHNDHFHADDLAIELADGANRVSRGTVYRTLTLMEEAGFVHSIRDVDTHRHYEHAKDNDQHEHMICSSCGAFIEFRDNELRNHIKKNCAEQNFKPTGYRIIVFGLCQACQTHGV